MLEISILLENEEKKFNAEDYSLTMDSSTNDILNAMQPVILEETGVNIKNEDGSYIYNVRKSTEKDTIFVLPKTVAG